MEPLTQPYFGKAIPRIPAPTKMRVILNEDDPIYSRTLGHDANAMLSAAAKLVYRVPRARTSVKWLTYVVVLSFMTLAGLFFLSGPRASNEEVPSPAPYRWDSNGSALGRMS